MKYPESEETQLLKALKENQESALKCIFKKYYPICCAYGERFVNEEDAKELASDTIIWLWEHRHEIQIDSSLSKYLLKSIYRRALNLLQKQQRQIYAETRFQEEMEEIIQSTDTHRFHELYGQIREVLSSLPTEYREAFIRHRFQNKKYKEIAHELGLTVQMVAYRILQVTRILQKKIGPILLVITWQKWL